MPSVDDILRIKPSGLYLRGEHEPRGFGGVPIPGSRYFADLIRVPVRHGFEIHRNGELFAASALPIDPSEIVITRPGGVDLQYTLGGVEREHTVHRSLRLEIVGRSGLKFRSGYNRQGEIVFLDGPSLLREFDAFLDYYNLLASGAEGAMYEPEAFRNHEDFRLVFRDYDRKVNVYVEVENWTRVSSASDSRFSERYTLALRGYAPVQPDEPGNFLGPIADAALLTAAAIGAMNNYIAVGDNVLTNVNNDLQVLKEPFRALERTGTLFDSLAGGVGGIVDFPRSLLASATRAVGQFRNAWESLKDVGDIWASGQASGRATPPTQQERELIRNAEELGVTLLQAAGASGAGPRAFQAAQNRDAQFIQVLPQRRTRAQDAPAERGQRLDVLRYQVRLGDTPETIASTFYGAVDRWSEVVAFGGWLDARTLADGSPFRAGVVIELPNTGYGEVEARRSTSDDPREVFGVDLLLGEDGDLVLNGDGTDVLTVTGPENLEQALLLRIRTRQGESSYFSGYGLPVAPGGAVSSEMFGLIGSHVREQFVKDPRVRRLENLALLIEGDTLGMAFDVIPVHSADPLPVSAPFPLQVSE